VPPKVEYRLTRKGKSFVPVIATIRNWGDRYLTEGLPAGLEHDPEKWKPVFRKDHAQTKI
jgi:DNA-binding HxlR family transcriptional regulator